jgi:FAD synthetase
MGKKVLCGGVFGLIHPGHCHFLQQARKLGDELVVVVASDRTAEKAGKKNVFPAKERAAMVGSISFVSRAVVGDEKDMSLVIKKEKPAIIAVGYDQDMDAVADAVMKAGVRCTIVRIGELPGYSTRKIRGG